MSGQNPYGQQSYVQYPYMGYGYPTTYSQRAYMQPQQPMQQMQQPQQQATFQYETPIQDIRFVTSEEAKAFIVMPNSKALLIDRNGGVAHLKTADNMGQSVTQYFKFEPINADGTPIKPQEPAPQVDLSLFAKKEDLNGFATVEQYNLLLSKIESLQKIMVGGKPNANSTNTTKQGN